jgi:hypothetical protein
MAPKYTERNEHNSPPPPDVVDELNDLDVDRLIPQMTVAPQELSPPEECIVKDEEILGIYEEILNNSRDDRNKIDEVLANFIDMVMNDGESSSASKEAIVNLLKIKSETNDKMAKVADLMTRIKLKEKDTYPRFLAAQQNNKVVINDSKREFLKLIGRVKDKDKKEKHNA